jgi:hypothetical protein
MNPYIAKDTFTQNSSQARMNICVMKKYALKGQINNQSVHKYVHYKLSHISSRIRDIHF